MKLRKKINIVDFVKIMIEKDKEVIKIIEDEYKNIITNNLAIKSIIE